MTNAHGPQTEQRTDAKPVSSLHSRTFSGAKFPHGLPHITIPAPTPHAPVINSASTPNPWGTTLSTVTGQQQEPASPGSYLGRFTARPMPQLAVDGNTCSASIDERGGASRMQREKGSQNTGESVEGELKELQAKVNTLLRSQLANVDSRRTSAPVQTSATDASHSKSPLSERFDTASITFESEDSKTPTG